MDSVKTELAFGTSKPRLRRPKRICQRTLTSATRFETEKKKKKREDEKVHPAAGGK